jgi:PadR family transcriptional regulator
VPAARLALAIRRDFFYIVDMRAPGEFERAVMLAILRIGSRAYGVAIRHELEKRLSRSISFGAVYTTLERLVEKGMVSSEVGEPTPERGGRAKKFFHVEPLGLRALDLARQTSSAIWAISPIKGLR